MAGKGSPDDRADVSSAAFLASLVNWIEEGGGIVPLLGAGVSVSAGVPVLAGMQPYLRDCIVRSLPRMGVEDLGVDAGDTWNPHIDPWPALHESLKDARARRDRAHKVMEKLKTPLELLAKEPEADHDDPEQDKTVNDIMRVRQAFGAQADWQDSLNFLARLTSPDDGDKVSLGAINPWVIDEFFKHMCAFAVPALQHHMFAALADVMRVRVSLTTNFDTLYEDAFADFGRGLRVFDVHQDAPLPSGHAVLAERRSLVKLHGSTYGFRADSTLNAPPTNDDRRRFLSYVIGKAIESDEWERRMSKTEKFRPDPDATPRCFLVAGVSGSDQRILRLLDSSAALIEPQTVSLKHHESELGKFTSQRDTNPGKHNALKSGEAPLVYWIAHHRGDIEKLSSALQSKYSALRSRTLILQEQELGQLLLDLYQRISKAIPRSGVESTVSWQSPTPPSPTDAFKKPFAVNPIEPDGKAAVRKNLLAAIDGCRSQSSGERLVFFTSPRGSEDDPRTSDAMSSARYAYNSLVAKHRRCIWLELDEALGVHDFFERMMQAMCKVVGLRRWLPSRASQHPPLSGVSSVISNDELREQRRVEFDRVVGGTGHDWVIFIDVLEECYRDDDERFKSRDWTELSALLRTLSDVAPKGSRKRKSRSRKRKSFPERRNPPTFVIVTYQYDGQAAKMERAKDTPVRAAARGKSRIPPVNWLRDGAERHLDDSDLAKWVDTPETTKLQEEDKNFIRYAYAQTFFELPRHPVALSLWAIRGRSKDPAFRIKKSNIDVLAEWQTRATEYRQRLVRLRWARLKSGGFLWMHFPIKKWIRDLADRTPGLAATVEWQKWPIDIHQSIADWYHKLFVASSDPPALFESIKHRIQAAKKSIDLILAGESLPDERVRPLSGLREATMLLRFGRETLLSRGHTAGSCARLDLYIKRLIKLRRHIRKNRVAIEQNWLDKGNVAFDRLSVMPADYVTTVDYAIDCAIHEMTYVQFRLALEVNDAVKSDERYTKLTDSHESLEAAKADLQDESVPATSTTAAIDYSRLRHDFDDAVQLGSSRRLNEAADVYKDLLDQLCQDAFGSPTDPNLIPQLSDPNSLRDVTIYVIREKAAKWGYALRHKPKALDLMIRISRRLTQLDQMRREVLALSERVEGCPQTIDRNFDKTDLLHRAALTYHFGAELTRFVDSHDPERMLRERIRLKTHFGLVLAVAGEHSEGRQRFNEAEAISAQLQGQGRALQDEIVGVHRAEAILLRTRQQDEMVKDRWEELNHAFAEKRTAIPFENATQEEVRRPAGLLLDAEAVLDLVQDYAMGRRKNVWWMSRFLYLRALNETLRLVVFSDPEHGRYKSRMTEMRGTGLPSGLKRIAANLHDLTNITRTDPLVLARAVHVAILAHMTMTAEIQSPAWVGFDRKARTIAEIKDLRYAIRTSARSLSKIEGFIRSDRTMLKKNDHLRRTLAYCKWVRARTC